MTRSTKPTFNTAKLAIAGVRNCAIRSPPRELRVISGVTRSSATSSINGMTRLMNVPIGLRISNTSW